jgi:hypothetical protein
MVGARVPITRTGKQEASMKVIYDIFLDGVYQGYAWAIGPTQAIRDFTGEREIDWRYSANRSH